MRDVPRHKPMDVLWDAYLVRDHAGARLQPYELPTRVALLNQ